MSSTVLLVILLVIHSQNHYIETTASIDRETYVAKNSSGSDSRVSAFLSCFPSKAAIKGVVLVANVFLETWLAGANATEPDARKEIATTSREQK